MYIIITIYGRVKKSVMPLFIFWIIFLLDLELNFIGKLLVTILRQGYRHFKLRKAFSKFYRRHSALLEKYSVSLKTLLQQGIPEPEFYGDLVYRFKKKKRWELIVLLVLQICFVFVMREIS